MPKRTNTQNHDDEPGIIYDCTYSCDGPAQIYDTNRNIETPMDWFGDTYVAVLVERHASPWGNIIILQTETSFKGRNHHKVYTLPDIGFRGLVKIAEIVRKQMIDDHPIGKSLIYGKHNGWAREILGPGPYERTEADYLSEDD